MADGGAVERGRRLAQLRAEYRTARAAADLGSLARVTLTRAELLARRTGPRTAQASAWAQAAVWAGAIVSPDGIGLAELAVQQMARLPTRLEQRVARHVLAEVRTVTGHELAVGVEARIRARALALGLAESLPEDVQVRDRLDLVVDYGRLHGLRVDAETTELTGGEIARQPLVYVDTMPEHHPGPVTDPSAPCRFLRPTDPRATPFVAEASFLHELAGASITRVVTATTVLRDVVAAQVALGRLVREESVPWPVLGTAVAAGFAACGRPRDAEAWRRIAHEPSIDAARRLAARRVMAPAERGLPRDRGTAR